MSPQRKYDTAETWLRIQAYCAYQERSHQEVRDKLYGWGSHRDEVESLIVRLLEGNFLNEERFARAYVSGKFRIKKWGKTRIARELKLKQVSEACIRLGMQEIESEDYLETVDQLLKKRLEKDKDPNEFQRRGRACRYVISRGFEPDLVWGRLNLLVAEH